MTYSYGYSSSNDLLFWIFLVVQSAFGCTLEVSSLLLLVILGTLSTSCWFGIGSPSSSVSIWPTEGSNNYTVFCIFVTVETHGLYVTWMTTTETLLFSFELSMKASWWMTRSFALRLKLSYMRWECWSATNFGRPVFFLYSTATARLIFLRTMVSLCSVYLRHIY